MIHSTEVPNSCQLPSLPSITPHPEGLDILKNGRQIMSCLKCLMSPHPNPRRASRPGRVENFQLRPSHSLRCIPSKSYNRGKIVLKNPVNRTSNFELTTFLTDINPVTMQSSFIHSTLHRSGVGQNPREA